MNALPPEQLLAEVEDILRTMPATDSLGNDSADVLTWLGRASAAIHAWDSIKATTRFDASVARLSSMMAIDYQGAVRSVVVMLHQARHDLRMKTIGPLSVNVTDGAVFDYFDEIRKVLETARTDLLFVDPYLDAEFVSRYLPHVHPSVTVRLLGRERMASLVSAATQFRTQSDLAVAIRSAQGFHDRYVFVDSMSCYQSGASFKDGAKKSPTTLTQITDAFDAVRQTYETIWAQGKEYS